MMVYLMNGEFTEAAKAHVHVSDLGLSRGYAVFDFFRFEQGVPLFMDDYLARFFRSAELTGLRLPLDKPGLEAMVYRLIERNGAEEGGIKLLLTGGYSKDGFTPGEPNLILTQHPASPYDARLYREGARLLAHPYVRDLPEAKTTHYVMVLSLQKRLKDAGAMDALFHSGGVISETSRSNVFVLGGDGVLRTPAKNVLEGVTRKRVLELARERLQVLEEDVPLEAVREAKEVFMTSTLRGVMPVTRLDGLPIGDGKPGELTLELTACFKERVQREIARGLERRRLPAP